jgi:aminopeptidase N
MPVAVAVYVGNRSTLYRFTANRNHQVETIANVAAAPQMVLFDPNANLLRELDFKKTTAQLGYQLLHAPGVGDRLWAASQLGNVPKRDAAAARKYLRAAALGDPFYGVRADVMDDAAAAGDAATLRDGANDKDLRVAIAALDAVEDLPHSGAGAALVTTVRRLESAANPLLAGAAYRALGATKTKGAFAELTGGLAKPAFRQVIASGAIEGFANLGDASAIPLVEKWAAYGAEESVRPVAIRALAKLAKGKPVRVQAYLEAIVQKDPYFRARSAAAAALGTLGQTSSLPVLEAVERSDAERSVRDAAWDAVADIEDAAKKSHGKKPAS